MGILGKRKATRQVPRRRKMVRRMVSRPVRSLNNAVHTFRRNATAATVTGNVAYAPYQSSTNIALTQVVNSTDFTNLFDQFRINYVVIKFWLRIDPSAQAAGSASFPKLYWVRDKNSTTVLSQNEMRERADCKIVVMNPNRPVVMKFKPNLLTQQLYTAVGTSSYTPAYNQWIDAKTSAATFYYGALWNIDDLTNTNYKVDIESTYYFQCKNTQ